MSNPVGSHHSLFNQAAGLNKQPAAPIAPPMIEIAAAGFFCLIHEQTVSLLKTITPAARANSRHAINQRKCDPISTRERGCSGFLYANCTWRELDESAASNWQLAASKISFG